MIADLKHWAWLTQFASLVLVPLLLAYLKGIFAAKTTVERLIEAQSGFETRLSLAEQRLAAAPTQRDFSALRADFSALHGDLRALTAELRGFKELFARAEGSLERLHRALSKDRGGC